MSTPSSPDPSQPTEPETWEQEPEAETPTGFRETTSSHGSPEPDTGTITSPYDEPHEPDAGAPAPDPAPATDAAPAAATSAMSADTADRQHRVERPVPRSGLAEHNSAAFLTGERDPQPAPVRDTVSSPDRAASDPAAAGPQPSWVTGNVSPPTAASPAPAARNEWTPRVDDGPDTAVILDGASVTPTVRSRARAHWLGVLVSIVLLPVAWYLLADAGARLTLPAGSPWQSGNMNIAALLEVTGGLVALAVVLLAARWSSVGSIVVGSLVLVLGVPFIAVPEWTQDLLAPALEWLQDVNDLGANVAHHLVASGSTGRFVVYGLALILIGVVSHGARRQGRREALAGERVARG